jgi:acetylornithine/LysW-gamma-L-lysine aminotransferase
MEIEDRYGSGVAGKRGLVLVRGQGSTVWDADGRAYLDCCSGHGVANVGHTNPAVTEAICRQAGTLMIMSDIFHNDVRAHFLERLMSVVPAGLERAYLGNSGTEAVEAALKFARLSTGRAGVVAAMRGFHGRTMGSLSATWEPHYREPFMPLIPSFSHVPYNKLDAMRQAVDENTAAVSSRWCRAKAGCTRPANTSRPARTVHRKGRPVL